MLVLPVDLRPCNRVLVSFTLILTIASLNLVRSLDLIPCNRVLVSAIDWVDPVPGVGVAGGPGPGGADGSCQCLVVAIEPGLILAVPRLTFDLRPCNRVLVSWRCWCWCY